MGYFRMLLLCGCMLLLAGEGIAQTSQRKAVIDLSSGDTAVMSVTLRQLRNFRNADPQAQLELVCHGPAVKLLMTDSTFFREQVVSLKKEQVEFKACGNSMKRMNIKAEQLLPESDVVPAAIVELSDKQQEGWSYIKAGR